MLGMQCNVLQHFWVLPHRLMDLDHVLLHYFESTVSLCMIQACIQYAFLPG